jgi:hypothetical protein
MPTTWQALTAKSGLGPITLFDAVEHDVETRIAGEVKDFELNDTWTERRSSH